MSAAYKIPNLEIAKSNYVLFPNNFGYDLKSLRLSDPFRNNGLGRAYSSDLLVQNIAVSNGYKIPERESLPYMGTPEALTNKTSIN